jgi:hypothetical protein
MAPSDSAVPRRLRTTAYGLLAVVFAVLAVGVAFAFGSTSLGRELEWAVHDAVSGLRDGGWRLVRGGLGRIVPAASAVAIVVLTVAGYRRRGPTVALAAVVVVVGANLTDQAVKRGVLPFPPSARSGAEPLLSGHPPLVLSVGLLAALVASTAARRLVIVVAGTGVVLTAVGVVVSGWHTLGEVVAPVLLFAAWACIGGAIVAAADEFRRPARSEVP